jgi:hypothetical protein
MRDRKGLTTLWELLVFGLLSFASALITACGTLDISLEERGTKLEPAATLNGGVAVTSTVDQGDRESFPAVAWYGSIHNVPGAAAGFDYLKPWHLDIWPKFGPAVGLVGADPAVEAEIARLRDTDVKATFWGNLTCGVADYGSCQLLVEQLSADDGGPYYGPDKVEGWSGTIGRLPIQPGSQKTLLYFMLEGEVVALYGIGGGNASIQNELDSVADSGATVRIWGNLDNKAQQLTGTRINVNRLELVTP